MVDKSAIYTAVCHRNALRKMAGLPLLNVRQEYDHQLALAIAHDHAEFADQFGDQRLLIREQVIADLRAEHGPDFGRTMGGRWAVNHETNKRFHAWIRDVQGVALPPFVSKNAVIYGEDASAVLVELDAHRES